MGLLRGAAAGVLGLAALQAVVGSDQAATRVGSGVGLAAGLFTRLLDPAVAGVPNLVARGALPAPTPPAAVTGGYGGGSPSSAGGLLAEGQRLAAPAQTAAFVTAAERQVGTPYRWGANTPGVGFDCSGLVWFALTATGMRNVPRTAATLQTWATPVASSNARPGDLVFYGAPAHHVGIYLGAGVLLNAPFTGARVRRDPVAAGATFGRVPFGSSTLATAGARLVAA